MTLAIAHVPPAHRRATAGGGVRAALERLPAIVAVHDGRLADGRPAGSVAIAPSGVWVVDERVEAADARALTELEVRADDLTRLVGDELFWAPARAVLCMTGGARGAPRRPRTVGEVTVCRSADLGRALTRRPRLPPDALGRLADRVIDALGAHADVG